MHSIGFDSLVHIFLHSRTPSPILLCNERSLWYPTTPEAHFQWNCIALGNFQQSETDALQACLGMAIAQIVTANNIEVLSGEVQKPSPPRFH